MHTYPEVLFKAVNLTSGGDCNPDKAPVERHISFGSASNILGDPEEVRLSEPYTPECYLWRPFVLGCFVRDCAVCDGGAAAAIGDRTGGS